jgi:hypothetical protein
MELKDVRVGNIVKDFEYSSRGRGLLEGFYRVEYDDLGYHNFMLGIPISMKWCMLLRMDIETPMPHANANFDWIAESAGLKVRSFNGEITVFHTTGGVCSILEHIKYVHQLQNFYYGYWGFEIDEENPTEFYKIKDE